MVDNTIRIKIELLLGNLNAQLQSVRSGLSNLGSGNNNAKKALDDTEKSAGVLGSTIGRVSSDIKGMLAGAFAVGALVAFTNKLVETVRVIQDLRLRLSGLTQGNEDFAASEAYLTDLAHKHHKSVQDLTAGFSSFLALEQSGIITRQQSIQLLEGFSNAASKTGASQTQMGQSVYGLAQALGTGIVAMEEFKQITEPMPGLANSIAKAFGMTVGELRKLIGTGTVASEEFGKKFVIALQDYEGAAQRAGGTISASYADVGNAYTEMAKELEKPIAGLAIGVTDMGKTAYGWLKDNGDGIVNLLTGIAVVMAGKGVAAMAAYTQSGIESIQVEQAHTAAIIENETRTVTARETKVLAAQVKLRERTATAELAQAELLLTAATLEVARANELASGSTAMLVDAEIAQTAAATRLANATRSQAAADAFLISQNARLAESQLALTAATNASGVAMTRIAAAGKAAFSFIGGWVGVAVLALWGLYEVLERVSDSEGNAERKTKNLSDALSLMNAEVKKLSIAEVDIDFSKTERNIASLKQQIKDLEASTHFGNINENIDKRAVLQQRIAVEEKHLDANKAQKNDLITNFDASGLDANQLTAKLKETENEIGKIRYHIEELKRSSGDATVIDGLINESKLALNAYNSQLSAIKGAQDTLSNTSKPNAKIAEANAKAEEKAIASSFKVKEELAKNAYEIVIAEADKDSVKKLQIEKDYNAKSLSLTLERLSAEASAKIKISELSGKKTKAPELQAELADIESQRLIAIDNAKTKGVKIDIDTQKQADDLREKTLNAQFDLESSRIDLSLAKAQAEVKTAVDDLNRLKGENGGKNFDAELKTASQKYGFDYTAVLNQFANSAAAHNVPESLLKSQAFHESGFNPHAKSDSGAVGFSQFLEGTAQQYGLHDRTNPLASIEAQATMLAEKIKQYGGRLDLALAAYNGGDKGANYLASNPQYLKKPDNNAPANQWKNQTANYQKNILSDAGIGDEKSLVAGIKHYHETKIKEENKGIDASIAAVKAKMALAEKEYTAKKATATPEERPKLDADYTATKEKLKQELSQLQADLLAIQKDGNAAMKKEIARAKQEELDIAETEALDLIKLAETEAQQQMELGNLSNSQFLTKQKAFEAQRYQIALKAAQDRRALLDGNDTVGMAKAFATEKQLTTKHAAEMSKINHSIALDSKATFNSMVAPIKSAFSSTIQGILQGTTTLKQGLKNMAQSIVLSFAGALTNMAIDSAAHWAWELLGFGTKETTKTVIKGTSEAAQTAAAIAGDEARIAAQIAAAMQSKAIETTTATSSIAKKAASAGAGAYDAVVGIPFIGPVLAPIAAAVAFAGVMAFGGMIASSAGGEWDVPNDRLNLVHKNETILPATIAAPMREFFTKQGNPNYSLPTDITQPQASQSASIATAASTIALQQSMLQAQQKQQRQAGGTVVLNTKGGDFVHKNDVIALLKKDHRNFRTA